MTEAKSIFTDIFNKHIKNKLSVTVPTVTFPDPLAFANPLSIVLLKLIEDNPFIRVLTSKDFNGLDLPSIYGDKIGYKRDFGSLAYLFINDKVILVDYSDYSFYDNCILGRLTRIAGPNAVDGAIKFQFAPKNYNKSPFPVYPFIYPGPNDLYDLPRYPKYYNDSLFAKFQDCCLNNSFKSQIFARWACFSYRKKFTELCDDISGSDVKCSRNMDIYTYMNELSQAKFAICARGNGKLSHREMECCAVGLPLLCQDTGALMLSPFIPDHHYIEIELGNFKDVFLYYSNHYDEALEIAQRGREYYLENHTHKGIQNLFNKIVNMVLGKTEWKQA